MSLNVLLPRDTAEAMTAQWPTKPSVHDLPEGSSLPKLLNAQTLRGYLSTGCAPADEINLVKNAIVRHPLSFSGDSRHIHPRKVAGWRDKGYTVQLRNLNRWIPEMAALTAAIQQETGYGLYVTGFLTPAGSQGLEHHWDQSLGVVVQLEGTKTWQLWQPVVTEPTRDYLASNVVSIEDQIKQWTMDGPDQTVELQPGQALILPRGWAHNPHSLNSKTDSVHLTFMFRERTPLWMAERMAANTITNEAFRKVISPGQLRDDALVSEVDRVRDLLIQHLSALNTREFAVALRQAAVSESDTDTI